VSVLAQSFDLAEPHVRVAGGTAWRAEDVDRTTRLDDPDLRRLHRLARGLRSAGAVGLVDGPGPVPVSAREPLVIMWVREESVRRRERSRCTIHPGGPRVGADWDAG
jgi:hypothetical protein